MDPNIFGSSMANADSGVPPSHMDQATDGINALHISEDALPVFTTSQALTETPPPALPHGMLQEYFVLYF